MPKKPMTVTDAYNKAKPKGKPSKEAYDKFNTKKPKPSVTEYKRNQITKTGMGSGNRTKTTSGMGSGNRTSIASVGAAREKVTRTGQGSGNKGPKKKNKGFFDRVGDVAGTVGRVGAGAVKGMTVDPVTWAIKNPKSVAGTLVNPKKLTNWGVDNLFAGKEIERILRGKGTKMDAGLAALSVIPIGGRGASKSLSELAEQATKNAAASGVKAAAKKAAPAAKKAAKKAAPAAKKAAAKETPAVAKKLDELAKIGGDKAGVAKRLREATPRIKKEIARDNVPQILPVKRVSRSATAADKAITSKGKMAAAKPTVNRTSYVPPAKVKSSKWDKNIAMSNKFGLPEEVKPVKSKKRTGPKVDSTPKAGSMPKKKPAKPAAQTAQAADRASVSRAQENLKEAREALNKFKAEKGASYRQQTGYKKLSNAVTRAEQRVNNTIKSGAPRRQRGVTQITMTDGPVRAGDAQRTYSGVGRSETPRNGMTGVPRPNRAQYEGDRSLAQIAEDRASMSHVGLQGSKRGSRRATREGRAAENKAKNVQNINIRENERKVAKYEEMRQKALRSKKPKDVMAAKKYAEFWGLKGIKRLK